MVVTSAHRRIIFPRRIRVLATHLAEFLPRNANVLDLGCGDGALAHAVSTRRSDVTIVGIDVLVRGHCHIPVTPFDGITIPYGDASFDAVMLVDVLHHSDDPATLLSEAARVTKDVVLLKDHLLDGFLAGPILRAMDWVGNARFGVALPYRYFTAADWDLLFERACLVPVVRRTQLHLYPPPLSWFCDRSLHLVAALRKADRC